LKIDGLKDLPQLAKEHAENSTAQGFGYIFLKKQTQIGKIFWSATVSLMMLLGIYWSLQVVPFSC